MHNEQLITGGYSPVFENLVPGLDGEKMKHYIGEVCWSFLLFLFFSLASSFICYMILFGTSAWELKIAAKAHLLVEGGNFLASVLLCTQLFR